MEILYLVIGLMIGGLLAWFALRSKFLSENQQTAGLLLAEQEKAKTLDLRLLEQKKELEVERNKASILATNLASTETNYINLEEKLKERKKEVEELQNQFALQFKNLANDIFEEKSKKFTDQNKVNIIDILSPLKEKIAAFEKKVEESNTDNALRSGALKEQLENLQKLNIKMTQEAENLTKALKGDTKAQGAWGEFILESILEKTGLEKDREYTVQESFTTADGRLRPDVIVKLPGNKHVIIDSKVSLTAYNNFINSDNEEEKALALKAHLLSIRQHMKGLSDKKYQNLSESSLDFVIMFIPIEPAYILAIQSDSALYEDALDKRIMFVSPTLLIPSLQLIKNVWKQEYQNKHVLDIANKAGDLYDKFVGFTDDLIKIGQLMDSSKKTYDESMKKLSTGSGNIVKRVDELKKLGAKASKSIDQRLLNRAEDSSDSSELFN
jgi:DNA recombination protein RmuC